MRRCDKCCCELSACGDINTDGEPSLDCPLCMLREENVKLRESLADMESKLRMTDARLQCVIADRQELLKVQDSLQGRIRSAEELLNSEIKQRDQAMRLLRKFNSEWLSCRNASLWYREVQQLVAQQEKSKDG